jgi:biotin-(acetyl-CoA carboxylase) ligase
MLARWRELSPSCLGASVEVLQAAGTPLAGKTAGLDADGALLVSVGGAVRRVIAGEVRWL